MALKKSLGLLTQTAYYLGQSWKAGACVPTLQTQWAQETLRRFQIQLSIKGDVSSHAPLLLVGNHISYLDIAILMAAVPQISFVAKKELRRWPIFGTAAEAMKTIFVNRTCTKSRGSAREAIREGLRDKRRIVVFPSGTTCVDESKPWRRGVFEIANELNIPVQPFRLRYAPLRTVAYIDNDFFPAHIYSLARQQSIIATIEFAPPTTISNPVTDCERLHEWTKPINTKKKELKDVVEITI